MVKEYDDIVSTIKTQYLTKTKEDVEAQSVKVFKEMFGVSVDEANDLNSAGKWEAHLKQYGCKEFSNPNEFLYTFTPTDFELKSEGEDYYLSGFVSGPEVDENGDFTAQEKLLTKLQDDNNPYALYLSYKHKWLKGDKTDFDNALGVRQRAEMKENPKTKKQAVWAEYKLLKTSPYYDAAIYDIKNKGVSGFSIEFRDAKRKMISIGSTIANFLEDYVFGGVGIVARAAVKSTLFDGFYAKEFIYNGGENTMEGKEDKKEVVDTKVDDTQKVEEQKQDDSKKVEENKTNEDLEQMKSELEAQKAELEKLKIQQEKEKVMQELENLKAKSKVLVEQGEKKLTDGEVKTTDLLQQQNDQKAEIEKIVQDKTLSNYDKISKIIDKTFPKEI
jgi:hypothetical protein